MPHCGDCRSGCLEQEATRVGNLTRCFSLQVKMRTGYLSIVVSIGGGNNVRLSNSTVEIGRRGTDG